MSLSKKHPLRLLLPSDLAQAFPGEPPSSGTEAAETDGHFALLDDVPAPENNSHEEHNGSQFQKIASYSNGTMFSSDSDLSEPLPYSTPGPASHLGGFSVGSKTTLSAASLQTSSSPTLFNIDGHLPLHKQSPQPINRPSSKMSTAFRYYDGLLIDELEANPDALPLADNPYLSQIYATPGPTHRAPAIQSGSPTEVPLTLESDATLSHLTVAGHPLDFHWRPFNRKTLVAPVLSKAPAFICDGKPKTNSDNITTVNTDRPPLATSQTRDAVQPPISPSPFFFSPLDIVHLPPAESAIDPESQDPPEGSETPPLQMLPSSLIQTIYSVPLSLPSGRTPGSLSLAETGIFSKVKAVPKGEHYAVSEDSFTLYDDHNLDSERSLDDSVEFWNN